MPASTLSSPKPSADERRAVRSVCVYCGSSMGVSPAYAEAAEELGRAFAKASIRLVYGGGSVGLMGTIARATMENGGRVTGIIPRFLKDREVMLTEVDELIVTADMHERKRLMFEHSDAFVALPGGVGTLEEVVEMMTWSQLGQHDKPIILVDIAGFWSPLVDLIDHMRKQAFIRPQNEIDFHVEPTAAAVLERLVASGTSPEGGDASVIKQM